MFTVSSQHEPMLTGEATDSDENKLRHLLTSRTIATAVVLICIVPGFIAMVKAQSKEKYPTPGYVVLASISKDIEIRRYAPRIVAQVNVSGAGKESLNEGFRILAGYIFGRNHRRGRVEMSTSRKEEPEKLAMTAPVTAHTSTIPMTSPVTASGAITGLTVSFFMPPSYSLATLPEPDDKRIKLIELPEQKYAAIRFSGGWNESNFDKHEKCLLERLSKESITTTGTPVKAYYNPPFTLPFLRRNEVLVSLVEGASAG